ncbi:hypothetical protein VNO77_16079 [Canavalia gladiata]|uniref:Uncharacterized protein n=1 Tax=Canavalia gladiata TaxID=3824 RepID=A0AAN9LZV4_CANGL
MEVEIISRQCIKPSSPTPIHLKTHNLSILDHFMPPIYIPMVLFYSADQSTKSIIHIQQKLQQLKESLSQVLTQFYPFAGRIKDNFTIDCNDEGIQYTEAKASCSLVEFFSQSNFSSFIHKLVPNQPIWEASIEGYTTMIQVTCFTCGGIVIGTLISHMIADGASASFFLNSWASSSRREFQHEFALPSFDSPFPRSNSCLQDTNVMALCGQFLNKGRLAIRRFLFNAEAISKLKAQASSLTVQNPTRVEVVTSLLWKCAANAFRANSVLERPTLVTHAVNMRRRVSPNFPNSCMGNFVWMITALLSAKEKVTELPDLVIKLREAGTSINSDFVKGFQGEGGLAKYSEFLKQLIETASSATFTNGVNYVHYTSWCNFGLYEVDFGWGKPIWVSRTTASSPNDAVFLNSVILMDTPDGKGIEVWIYLIEDDMAMFQLDKELLNFVISDPNPLHLKDYISKA